MASEEEYCINEVGGVWTNNADAWDGDDSDAASTSTDPDATWGNITGSVFSDMGDGDTILGIEVDVVAEGDGGDTCKVELYKPSDTGYIAQSYSFAPGSKDTYTVGAADNTWGETWSPANDIKQATFGVRLTYDAVSKANTMSVYCVLIRVTYATITSTTYTKTMAIRYLKEQTTTKTSGTRYKKPTTYTKTSAARYLLATVVEKTSAIRYIIGNLIDKTCAIRYFKEQSLSKTCGCKYVEEGAVGARSVIGGKKETGSRTVHK